MRRLVAMVFSTLLVGALSFAQQDKPLDQKGHDERVKREKATQERVERDNRVQKQQDAIRQAARNGGYEGAYDHAIDKHAGPRTKESVDKSRPKTGGGHDGDNANPGLTGKEGGH